MTIYVISDRTEIYDDDHWVLDFDDFVKESYYTSAEAAQADVDRMTDRDAEHGYKFYVRDKEKFNERAALLQKEKEAVEGAGLKWSGSNWESTIQEVQTFEEWRLKSFKPQFRVEELKPA